MVYVFDARAAIGHHVISAAVGVVSLTIALGAPLGLAPIAPTAFFLMGPAHFAYGARTGRKRRLLVDQLATDVSAEVSA